LVAAWLLLLLFFAGCSSDEKPAPETAHEPPSVEPSPVLKDSLVATMNYFRVRQAPDMNSETVYMLSENESVLLLDVSDPNACQRVTLRGFPYCDPWVKVRTHDGTEGWAYGGGFKAPPGTRIGDILTQSRLAVLFGKDRVPEIQTYRKRFEQAAFDGACFQAYVDGKKLRDETQRQVQEVLDNPDPTKLPDLSWLKEALPAFFPQLVAEGTRLHLFLNYKEWLKKARHTKGTQDDDFFRLAVKIYPIDSIESFYPVWFLQTWDYGGHSLLGSGIHRDLLDQMNRMVANRNVFEPEILDFKNQLIQDMTDAHVTYWEPKDAILKELDEIIAANYGILTEEDKIALQTRRKMFKDPAANHIEVNHRAGIHDT